MTRYLDEFQVGETFATEPFVLGEDEIISFARAYDPQPFHVDTEAAKGSAYGGLIASGFQTTAIGFGQFARLGLIVESSMGGPGLDEVRWLAPVRPGDRLDTVVEVVEARPSRRNNDRGIVRFGFTINNQDGKTVCTFITNSILKRDPAVHL
jgi:acyl dehydratase